MFGLFEKKLDTQKGVETITFEVRGLHCTSCSLNIDGELEDTDGVIAATTSYAQSKTTVQFDPTKTTQKELASVISTLGYSVTVK